MERNAGGKTDLTTYCYDIYKIISRINHRFFNQELIYKYSIYLFLASIHLRIIRDYF